MAFVAGVMGIIYVAFATPHGEQPAESSIQICLLMWIFGVLCHIASDIEKHRK